MKEPFFAIDDNIGWNEKSQSFSGVVDEVRQTRQGNFYVIAIAGAIVTKSERELLDNGVLEIPQSERV